MTVSSWAYRAGAVEVRRSRPLPREAASSTTGKKGCR